MDRAAVSEAANGSSNLPGSTTFESLIHTYFVEDLLFGLLQAGLDDGGCECYGFCAAPELAEHAHLVEIEDLAAQ